MKTGFFYGVFAGFILGCLFFFGVTTARGQGNTGDTGQKVGYYGSTRNGTTLAYGGQGYVGTAGGYGINGGDYRVGGYYTVGGPGRGGLIG